MIPPAIQPLPSPYASPDALAAHDFLSELRTRIAVQRLPYQHGVEAGALKSLYELFGLARKTMKEHPGCGKFARITTRMLNVDLRPVTAKWHRAYEAGLLESRDGADEFRAELGAVRLKLQTFSLALQEMAYGTIEPDADTPPAISADDVDRLLLPLRFGLGTATDANPASMGMNSSEGAAIRSRRDKLFPEATEGFDAIGLALSGGGIRSATFCAGVLQVLTDRNLMGQFDYLSTVSGGGYTGSFITSWIGGDGSPDHLSKPRGPDTQAFRHVRQHARYLSATDVRSRWAMIVGTLAGMLLNWTAPLFVIATAAALFAIADGAVLGALRTTLEAMTAVTAVALLGYGVSLHRGTESRSPTAWLAGFAGVTAIVAAMLAIELGYGFWADLRRSVPATTLASLAVAMPAVLRFLPIFRRPAAREAAAKVLVAAAGLAVPILAIGSFYLLRQIAEPPVAPRSPADLLDLGMGWAIVAAIAAVSGAFAFLGLNVNATSPHKLYRDALARTFLHPGNERDLLSSVNASETAPYHLINATVNLPSSTSPVVRDRKGDMFLLSKFWSGSAATGYRRTDEWTVDGGPISLSTAMAISGAAASPRMGLGTKPTLAALLTLLNIRLGVWLPRPDQARRSTPGFGCLLREMTGAWMSEGSPWLNLTDGGHMENLGIYELLRRRCKFIVSVDGEADPKLTFHGNLTLVRHAQIDLGIRIDPRLDDLRLNPKGLSRTHAQLFSIEYPDEGEDRPAATGLLLYLKLSFTGNEAELLKRYRALHPDFPHQSTADQFYDEEQFEAYRQLGVHVAEGVFSPALLTSNPTPGTIGAWFRQLAENMLEPSTAPSGRKASTPDA